MRQYQTEQDTADHDAGSDQKPVLRGLVLQLAVLLLDVLHLAGKAGDLFAQLIAFVGDAHGVVGGALQRSELLIDGLFRLVQPGVRLLQLAVILTQFGQTATQLAGGGLLRLDLGLGRGEAIARHRGIDQLA